LDYSIGYGVLGLSGISEKIRKLAESDRENSELFRYVVDRLNELESTKATLECPPDAKADPKVSRSLLKCSAP
jgi:hypothetical protein